MYINPFWRGVFATVLFEVVAVVLAAIIFGRRR